MKKRVKRVKKEKVPVIREIKELGIIIPAGITTEEVVGRIGGPGALIRRYDP